MKTLLLFIALSVSCFAFSQKTLHDFTVVDIEGNDYQLSQLKGKKVLIVNTASKCGLTPQYKDLEKLYETFKDSNFIIIGFPANDFLKQEPGSDNEIAEFCQKNYGVSFPMMSKISVKGKKIHPLYEWLTSETKSEVQWNFQKYMVDESGKIVGYLSPRTSPLSDEIVNWIKK